MKKWLFLASLVVLCSPMAALAQEEAPDYELFGGYSYLRIGSSNNLNSAGFSDVNSIGFNSAFTTNFTKRIGAVVEFSRFTKSISISDPLIGSGSIGIELIPALFGVRYTLTREGKVEPFVHGLPGIAVLNTKLSTPAGTNTSGEVVFAYALGGGIDIKVHKNIAIRASQFDLLRVRFQGSTINNFRYSAGVVLRLGSQ